MSSAVGVKGKAPRAEGQAEASLLALFRLLVVRLLVERYRNPEAIRCRCRCRNRNRLSRILDNEHDNDNDNDKDRIVSRNIYTEALDTRY